jgi:hypothetical protein
MRHELSQLCPDCGRPQHKRKTCADVAEAEMSPPLRYPLCDTCFREHNPREECSLRGPEEEDAYRSRVAAGSRRYDRDSQ